VGWRWLLLGLQREWSGRRRYDAAGCNTYSFAPRMEMSLPSLVPCGAGEGLCRGGRAMRCWVLRWVLDAGRWLSALAIGAAACPNPSSRVGLVDVDVVGGGSGAVGCALSCLS
jgi:hypothetical protein